MVGDARILKGSEEKAAITLHRIAFGWEDMGNLGNLGCGGDFDRKLTTDWDLLKKWTNSAILVFRVILR